VPSLSLEAALGLAIRDERVRQNISQERLGQLTGLHRNHVGQIERGEMSPTLKSIELIADAFGVRTSALIAVAERLAGI
jgi:transcriptional regulator with XRE-family HTH domain